MHETSNTKHPKTKKSWARLRLPSGTQLQSGWVILVLSGAWLLGLGGCQDQQTTQQLDALKTSNADLVKRVQALEASVKISAGEMTQTKQLLQKFTDALQAQNTALENLNNAVKDVQTRLVQMTQRGKTNTSTSGAGAKKKH
jgi:hypothetical protein